MVLETIDTIKRSDEEQLTVTTLTKPFTSDDAPSPLSTAAGSSSSSKNVPFAKSAIGDTPKSVSEQRDAAVATPCDSIRSYANELTAVSSSLSNDDEKNVATTGSKTPSNISRTTSSRSKASLVAVEEERDAPPATSPVTAEEEPAAVVADVPAADVPASEAAVAAPVAVAEEPEPMTMLTVVTPPEPVTIVKVQSNVSQHTAVGAEATTSSEPLSTIGLDSNQPSGGPSRVTLITVTDTDECKPDLGIGGPDGANNMTRSRSEASHQSVEVFDVVFEEEAAKEPEAADEPTPETVTKPVLESATELKAVEESSDMAPAETKAAEAGVEDDATKSAPVEAETEGAAHATTSTETEVKESDAAPDESPAEPAAKPEGVKVGKKKKFALKKLSKPNLPKPNMLPKRPTSSMGSSVAKGLSMRFRTPSLSKMKSKKSSTVVAEDSVAKDEADGKATPTETATVSTAQEEITKEEEPAAAAKDAVPTTTEVQEPKEATMETVDLGDNTTSKPAASIDSPPSSMALESFVAQNTSMQVKEEIQKIEEEEKDDVSLGEVPVNGQATEVVTKKPIAEEEEEEKAEDGVLDTESETKSTWEETTQTFEVLYAKAEECFGDVTNFCGPYQKGMKERFGRKDKDGEEESADSNENDNAAVKSDKSTEVVVAVVPSTSVEKDTSDAAEKGDVDEKDATAAEGPVVSTIDGPSNNLLSPLSIATEQVSTSASSFMESLRENESVRSIVENLSMGVESVTKSATDTFFPRDADEEVTTEKSAQQEKLDKAAEMAKKALDGAPDDEEQQKQQQEKNTEKSLKKPPSGKNRFGFRWNNDKKSKSKPQLKISTVKEDVDAEKAAAASSDDKKPKSPTSQAVELLTRGFGGSKNKDARSKSSKSNISTSSKAQDMKKVASRLFKKPSGVSKKVGMKTEKVALPQNEAAVVEEPEPVASQDVQDDLIAESVSMNSQSLNEPQAQPSKEEAASAVEEATNPAAAVEETSEPASAIAEEAKSASPNSEATPAAPTEESNQEETLVAEEFKTVGIVTVTASESLVSEKSSTTPAVTTDELTAGETAASEPKKSEESAKPLAEKPAEEPTVVTSS